MDIQHYRETLNQPWGKIFYIILFEQLKDIQDQEILDFGAGFGITADYLSQHNHVTAIDPNADMLQLDKPAAFTKLLGSYEQLEKLADESFDTILCHNVLEYIPKEKHALYLKEFKRLLKPNGKLSVVKHHLPGKIMQTVVFSNDSQTALDLLAGKAYTSPSFQEGHTYSLEELEKASQLKLLDYSGIRTFYALQKNDFKTEADWIDKLSQIEIAVSHQTPYKDIAFFHHVWLEKTR